MIPGINVGDEVRLRGYPDQPVAVVTKNTQSVFCTIEGDGTTHSSSRAVANPIKTGRHFEQTTDYLKSIR